MMLLLPILLFAQFASASGTAVPNTEMLTPFYENITVASIGTEKVYEYEVFGYPSSARTRKPMPVDERSKMIEDHIFDLLLQKEGRIPDVLNSEDYKRNHEILLKKNAAMKMRDDLVKKKFFPDVQEPDSIAKYSSRIHKEIAEYIDSFIDSISAEYGVFYDDETIKEISELKKDSINGLANSIYERFANRILIKWGDQGITTGDLIRKIKEVKPYHLYSLNEPKIIKRMLDGKIINNILAEESFKQGYDRDKDVVSETDDQLKYLAGKKYKEILTADGNFVPSKDEMIDYYIANKDDRSLWSRRKMWVFEIFREYDNQDESGENDKVKVAIELENVRQKIIAGEAFEKYAKFYSRPYSKDGELGFIFEDDYALVGQTAAGMKEGEISDLIIQAKAISVIKVTQVQEPMLYKFDYVEEKIKKRLIEQKKEMFLNNLRNELFEKYKVKIMNANQQE